MSRAGAGAATLAAAALAAGCGLVGYEPAGDDGTTAPACFPSVSLGPDHGCVVNRAGRVFCWGKDERGQSSGAMGGGYRLAPVEVTLPTGAREVSVGLAASCAVLDDARLFCWGGRLGQPTLPPYLTPTEVQPGLRAFHVGLGDRYACAKVGTDTDDRVACWGVGADQRLGQADTLDHADLVTVPGPTGLAGLFVGPRSACALDGVGDVWCWGADDTGQLALGPGPFARGPTRVPALRGAEQLVLGDSGGCSLGNQEVRCWGANDTGQLGDGVIGPERRTPGNVLATGVVDVAALARSFCVTDGGGAVRCWGQNRAGELGLGDLAVRPDPIELAAITGVDSVAGGGHTACVEHNDQLVCWGDNLEGQLARGQRAIATMPQRIEPSTTWTSVVGAGGTLCALDDQSALYCWGDGELGQAGLGERTGASAPRMIKAGMRQVALGAQHGCARSDDQLWCWGQNGVGQLGEPTLGLSVDAPTMVIENLPMTSLALGDGHGCVVAEGAVRCWGANFAGQVGDGTMVGRPRPVRLSLAGATKVTAGAQHTCALDGMGGLWCWGSNASGQLGAGVGAQSADPLQVVHPGGGTWTQVVAGRAHTCAIDDQRTLWCWGANGAGQLGSMPGDSPAPRRVDWPLAIGDAHQVFIRHDSTCATTFGGEARCWGEDGWGAIGVGGTTPRPFGTVGSIASFGGGQFSLCAITTTGELWCAGAGDRGQLGTGLLGWSPMVVSVPCD